MPGCFSRLTERLCGRRQPTASTGCLNSFVFVFFRFAGFPVVRRWTATSKRDEAEFIRAYNDFVAYLSDPSKKIDIERELAEANIHHVNLIDVLFELVLFGMMTAQKSLLVVSTISLVHVSMSLY